MQFSKTIKAIFILGIIYFLLCIIPNAMGIKDEHMLSLLSQDESIQYPYLMHMLTPGTNFLETIKNFVSYQHYFYGYPFYLYSALLLLPFRIIFGDQFSSMVQMNLLILRQMVSVLPIIIAVGFLTYLQTRFVSLWKSILLFLFMLFFPAVIGYNLWFWHPDGMTVLGVALTLFFLDRDELSFGRNFYFAAIACGFTAATKVIGFFFFLSLLIYLAMGLIQKKTSIYKIVRAAFLFILILLIVFIALNPLLIPNQTRAQIIKIQIQQNFFVTHGWQDSNIYQTGLIAWLPYLQQWYAFPLFILFMLAALLYGCMRSDHPLTCWLFLGWIIPYSTYLVFFVATKPYHYWLPILLPLASGLAIFLPDHFFVGINTKKSINRMNSLQRFLPVLALAIIAFQLGHNFKEDFSIVADVTEREKLLIACNSGADNNLDGQTIQLNSERWYRVEVYDDRTSPPSRKFLVEKGNLSVTAYLDHGEFAWACNSQSDALFSADRLYRQYKEAHPTQQVIGP